LVACRCSQIPEIDHDEAYATVVNNLTFRVLLIIIIIFRLHAQIVDVETAFLHGDLEGIELYMNCPKSLKSEADEGPLLKKTIYGLVQLARHFFKKLTT
jgi:Reverse transcriptase (RNA-dependent DNA polymerase)